MPDTILDTGHGMSDTRLDFCHLHVCVRMQVYMQIFMCRISFPLSFLLIADVLILRSWYEIFIHNTQMARTVWLLLWKLSKIQKSAEDNTVKYQCSHQAEFPSDICYVCFSFNRRSNALLINLWYLHFSYSFLSLCFFLEAPLLWFCWVTIAILFIFLLGIESA